MEERLEMKQKTQWQGDVGLVPISKIPVDVQSKKGSIVAYGEATGHHHKFQDAVLLYENKQNLYAKVERDTQLVHQEHAPLDVKKGVYRVVRQRVFDVQKGIRQVMD